MNPPGFSMSQKIDLAKLARSIVCDERLCFLRCDGNSRCLEGMKLSLKRLEVSRLARSRHE